MYIVIKCLSCSKSFCVDFTSTEYNVNRCPKCGNNISFSDVYRIRGVTEPFHTNVNKLNDVNICGIYMEESGVEGSTIRHCDLFSSDMEQLNEIYRSSSPDVQKRLAYLIDKFYLLVNDDVRSANISQLDVSLENLRKLFMSKVGIDNKETDQSLELGQED